MKTGVAYLGVKDPHCVCQHMDALISQGYTHVCIPYSESDFLFYRRTMREIIDVVSETGLYVYVSPWGMGKVFDGVALSELAGANRSMSQVNNHSENSVAACINNQDFRQYLRDWAEEVCSTSLETVLWDNPHFFSSNGNEQWCCRCETCKKLFRKKTNHLMPNSLTDSVKAFREASIFELISELTGLVHTKGKRNSVCLMPPGEANGMQAKEEVAELPSVDEISLKPYWVRGERVAEISKNYHETARKLLAVSRKHGKEAQIWVKNFSIEKNNEESVAEATYAAYNEGIRNIFCWAYDGTRCMSEYRSDNHQRVWEIQTNAFAECHDKAIMNEMIDTMKSIKPSG